MANGKWTKKELIENPESPLNKAADGEPLFLLRGQDATAPGVVMLWSNRARSRGCPAQKCDDALECAKAMGHFPNRKNPD